MHKKHLLILALLVWLVACGNQPTPNEPFTPTDSQTETETILPTNPPPTPTIAPTATPENLVRLHYNVVYSELPALTYYDLTHIIYIGDFPDYRISTANGETVRDNFDENAGILTLTTPAPQFTILLPEEAIDTPNLGDHTTATLFDNKKWAWSHGFDDNVRLHPAIQSFQKYGYAATLFLIANIVDDTRQEDWITDAPFVHNLMTQGWSVGNHTFDHACYQGGDAQTVLDGYTRLNQVVANSPLPHYKILSFAAPCFDGDYTPTFFDIRDNGQTSMQFVESGRNYLHWIDESPNAFATIDERQVHPFTYDAVIGRDIRMETDGQAVLAEMDWIANNVSDNDYLWYNTMAHGEHEATVEQVLSYVDTTYGFNGTNEVWVAPSDRIYSYLMVRDSATVTFNIEP